MSIYVPTDPVSANVGAGADLYGLVDEIARRAWLAGAHVLAVRRNDIPAHGSVAAILRYPI